MQLTAWISPVFPFDREVAQDFTNLHPFFPAAIWFWELWQRRVLPAAFTGSMALSAQPVVPAAAAVATVAEAAAGAQPTSQLFTCKWCGLGYSGEQGRLHGNVFTCLPCNTHERSLRRNLGTETGLQQFSVEETHSFFRKLLQKKSETANGRLQYATVRAVLVNSVTERTVNSYKGQVSCSELPLSVYVQQGWAPDVVEKCPKVWSDKFGVYCYQVPVKTQTWAQCFERIESKLLQQEKEITKRKGKSTKDDPDDLDVPVSAAADKASSSKKEAKQAEAQARKLLQENHKISTVAAKALGPLVQSEASLRACYWWAVHCLWSSSPGQKLPARPWIVRTTTGRSPRALKSLPWCLSLGQQKTWRRHSSRLRPWWRNWRLAYPRRRSERHSSRRNNPLPWRSLRPSDVEPRHLLESKLFVGSVKWLRRFWEHMCITRQELLF